MSTDKSAEEPRRKTNPLFNDRKLKLGTFSSNLSGGCAITTIDGVLKADWQSTLTLARLADEMEFEALVPVGRWKGFGGVTNFNGAGFEPYTWAAVIGAATKYSAVFATSHVPTVHPIMAAKQATTIDHVTGGRFALNVVTGWFLPEIEMFGAPQMDHDLRYDCAIEWLEIIKRLWTEDDEFDHSGKYYQIKKGILLPKPIQTPYPVVMNAGGSEKGRHYAAKYCDVAFVIFDPDDTASAKVRVRSYRELAQREYGRDLQLWTSAYVVQGETEKDARDFFDYYVHQKGDWVAVTNLVETMGINAKILPPETLRSMKAHFIAGWGGYPLVGTAEQIVEGLERLAEMGLDGVVLSWPRYIDGMRQFKQEIMPLARQAGLRQESAALIQECAEGKIQMSDATQQTIDQRELVAAIPRELYHSGAWHAAAEGTRAEVWSPSTGQSLGKVAWAGAEDVDRAVRAAHAAFFQWRDVRPLERAKILREVAALLRRHGRELALIDAADCGNPIAEMINDSAIGAASVEYFAGLVTEVRGSTIPMGPGVLNYTLREPLGVIARINAFNHPLLFAAMRTGAPLATGNTLIVKPPEQAPLSSLRFAELVGPLFPPGVFSVLPGGRECGAALTAHPLVAKVGLIGSVPTGKAIMRASADSLKKVALELGGKNALIAYPDADPDKVAAGIIRGMNFTWCGQSCGSTSRAFLHETIHDAVLERVVAAARAIKPGIPTEPSTMMGSLISKDQFDKVMRYIGYGVEDGARLVAGGKPPQDPGLSKGFFIEPTIFADVTHKMRIAREEIFGPVLSVFRWSDDAEMLRAVNDVEYGLTASIWTRDLAAAHRTAARVEAGYVWVNSSSAHYLAAPFGGYKQSGVGREESIEELMDATQIKNVHVEFDA